jgi:hypothetical protein
MLTIEVAGKIPRIDTDQKIYTFFYRYYGDWFSAMYQITEQLSFGRPLPMGDQRIVVCSPEPDYAALSIDLSGE